MNYPDEPEHQPKGRRIRSIVVCLALWIAGAGMVDRSPSAAEGARLTARSTTVSHLDDSVRTASTSWGSPILTEDFSGSSVDPIRWRIYDAPDGQHPRRAANVRVANGELQLVGERRASGGIASRLDRWYGRWEVRLRIDRGPGYSGVALLWPQDEQWPEHGEIDLIEVPRGDRASGVSTVHHGAQNNLSANRVSSDFSQWHTVAVDFLPDHITFFLDGTATSTVDRPTDGSFDYIPHESPMHLALQNDIGCDGFIQCRDRSTPAQVVMHVDWVKIYAAPAGTH